jgi:hypothetical protein
MPAVRQPDLTRAAGAAFFEAALERPKAARCFLREGLAAENDDVRVETARGRR